MGKREYSMCQLRHYSVQYLYCWKQIDVCCITEMNPAVSYITGFVHRVTVSSNCKAFNLNHTELECSINDSNQSPSSRIHRLPLAK